MRFDHVLLEHFGPHRRLEFAPSPRLTAIVGPIGSGKSSTLAALEYLLCGKSPTSGVKEEDVCDRSGPKDVSRLVAMLTHGPHTLEVVRGLKRAKTELRLDGGDWVQGETRVNAELARLVGDAYPLLSDYAFVKQGLLSRFVDATPGDRAVACGRLFGIGRAAEVHAAIGKQLIGLEVAGESAELDTLRREVADDREVLAALDAELAALPPLTYVSADDPDRLLVEAYEQQSARIARYREYGVELRATIASREACEAECVELANEINIVESRTEAFAQRVAEARELLASWKAQERRVAQRERLEARLAAIGPEPTMPTMPADYGSGGPVELEAAQVHRSELRRLAAMHKAAVPHCPTCGTATDDPGLAWRIEAAVVGLPEAERAVAAALGREARASTYERALTTAQADIRRWNERRREVEDDIDALGDADDLPDVDIDECRKLVAVEERDAARLLELRSRRSICGGEGNHAAKRIALLRSARKRLDDEAKAAGLPVTEPEVERARERMASVTERLVAAAGLRGRRDAAEAALASKLASIARLEDEAARGERSRHARSRLLAMREVLDHKALPRAVARRELRKVEDGINALLDRFEAGFRVAAGDDLSFAATFHSGPRSGTTQPARRLSCGQKTLFAWAYRCEVNARCVGDVGLLALDEPTDGLAKGDLSCLDAAIATLRATADTRGLQCWLVTHEAALGRLFDSVITLS